MVAIDGWDTDSAYPSGHYVRTLGTIGDRCPIPVQNPRPTASNLEPYTLKLQCEGRSCGLAFGGAAHVGRCVTAAL